jgi:hypothetical protein
MHSHRFRTITAAAALTAFALLIVTAPAPAQQDLRSPDTRDAALISEGRMERPTSTTPRIHPVPGDPAARAPSRGFDRLDAAIGAAAVLGLALVATGTGLAVRRRTRGDHPAVA